MRRIRDRVSRSIIIFSAKSLVLGLALACSQFVYAETRGVLEVPETSFDFGQVRQGTVVKHDFALKNTGNADLAIQRVVAACGCTATSTSANVITPGGSVTLSAQFDTNGFSGKREKLIRVYTSDLDKPMATLSLSGEIVTDYTVEPANLLFDSLEPRSNEADRTKRFRLRINPDSGLQYESSESFSKYLTIVEGSKDALGRDFNVTISADAPPGDLRSRVVVHLKDAAGKDSAITVPVYANIKKSIRFEPSTISFGLIPPGKILERVVKLENRSDQPLKVLTVKSNNPAVVADLIEKDVGRDFVLKIKVDPSKLDKELSTSIDLSTDSPDQPTLSLTLLGFRAQAVSEPKG